jgi:hypothetical protein
MTRGKYAARATLRREDAGVRSELDSYQHHIKRLTAENQKLKADLAAEQTAHKTDVRRLKAQLDEGLSPELIALRKELERQRERAAVDRADALDKTDVYGRLLEFTAALLHNITGCTGLEAMERIVEAVSGKLVTVADASTGAVIKERTSEVVDAETLQRVRGWRSNPKVIEHLDAVIEAVQQELRKKQQRRVTERGVIDR